MEYLVCRGSVWLGRFFPGGLLPSWVEHCWFLGILGVLVGEPFVSALIAGYLIPFDVGGSAMMLAHPLFCSRRVWGVYVVGGLGEGFVG